MNEELERLRALSEAATPGPWDCSDYGEWLTNDKHQRFLIATPSPGTSPVFAKEARGPSDATFIVAAVNYVRDLLARDSAGAGLLDAVLTLHDARSGPYNYASWPQRQRVDEALKLLPAARLAARQPVEGSET